MPTNLERYRKDFASLLKRGNLLLYAIQLECYPKEFKNELKKQLKLKGRKSEDALKDVPSFNDAYQPWYSEAKTLIKQLLPDRLDDFVRYYEKPKSRKNITVENYRIEDCLQTIRVTREQPWVEPFRKEVVVGQDAAIPLFKQQLSIVVSIKARFESSLFDIRQLAQADLFDSELESSRELAKRGFFRAAGAVAGVVLEKHLSELATKRNIVIKKKHPSISDLNDALRGADVIEISTWRQIQRLSDVRNLCDHNKQREPRPDEVEELISGVERLSKTLF